MHSTYTVIHTFTNYFVQAIVYGDIYDFHVLLCYLVLPDAYSFLFSMHCASEFQNLPDSKRNLCT